MSVLAQNISSSVPSISFEGSIDITSPPTPPDPSTPPLMVLFVPLASVFPHMVKQLNTGLHVMILIFLFVAMALALVSMGFAILNMIKVPYRAINGPAGICLWNVLAGGVVALAIGSFMAAVKFHDLTDRIANFQEKIFQFVIVEEQYEESFWICVASAAAHAANLLVVAISQIPLPEIKTKIEEVTVTAEDILY
ncbi:clarin-2-like [Trichosurus vulpecula]|uniref:clarin-2-like n=1 Tax=Trichosurus vulpecula TaxID=9337 RepID=UPI00186B3B20|nr:clarin-2-like [Trichosurus vulpecula]